MIVNDVAKLQPLSFVDCGCVDIFCKRVSFSRKYAVLCGIYKDAEGVPKGGPFAHRNGQRRAVGHDGVALPALAFHLGHTVEVDHGVVVDADERIGRQGLLEMAQALGAGDGRHINKVQRAEVVLTQDVRDVGYLHLPEALVRPHDNPVAVRFHT